MKLLLARLQNRRLALPLASVDRVVLRPRLEVLPDLPLWLAGFLQLPGESLPVLDVGALFEGQRCTWDLYNPIVITRDEGSLALLFTAVEGLVEVPPEDFRPLQVEDSFQGVAAALIPSSQEWAPILVPKLLLIAQERRKLEHWREVLKQRVERLLMDRMRSVGETHFFRHPAQFDHMLKMVEARLEACRYPLRIWSAGCANGAEIYSAVLMLAQRCSRRPLSRERFQFTGSDFNAHAVEGARLGRFTSWHMRGCSERLREQYFQQVEGGDWQLDRDVVDKVDFFCHDLHDGSEIEPQDVIFCRNVLIYMDPPSMARVVDRLYRWLAPDGVLYLGYSEAVLAGDHPGLQLIDSSLAAYRPKNFEMTTLPVPVLLPPIPLEPLRPRPLRQPLSGRPEALSFLAEANQYAENDQPAQATRSLKKSLYLDPSLAVSHYQLGLLELGEQRVEQARRHWRNVITLARHHAPGEVVPGWDNCTWEQLLQWTSKQLKRLGDTDV